MKFRHPMERGFAKRRSYKNSLAKIVDFLNASAIKLFEMNTDVCVLLLEEGSIAI